MATCGNPGTTRRLYTMDQMALMREVANPLRLILFSEYRGRLIAAMDGNAERTREGADTLFSYENALKAYYGQQQALVDPAFSGKIGIPDGGTFPA